jgi:hypothetical protein
MIVYPKNEVDLRRNSHAHWFMMPVAFLVACRVFYVTPPPD